MKTVARKNLIKELHSKSTGDLIVLGMAAIEMGNHASTAASKHVNVFDTVIHSSPGVENEKTRRKELYQKYHSWYQDYKIIAGLVVEELVKRGVLN